MPQPTCVLMQIVRRWRPRSSTHSICPPSARLSSSFSVPSSACVWRGDLCRSTVEICSAKLAAQCLRQIGHRIPVGGALLEQPLAHLDGTVLRQTVLVAPCSKSFINRIEHMRQRHRVLPSSAGNHVQR